jgi:hypothetical protein
MIISDIKMEAPLSLEENIEQLLLLNISNMECLRVMYGAFHTNFSVDTLNKHYIWLNLGSFHQVELRLDMFDRGADGRSAAQDYNELEQLRNQIFLLIGRWTPVIEGAQVMTIRTARGLAGLEDEVMPVRVSYSRLIDTDPGWLGMDPSLMGPEPIDEGLDDLNLSQDSGNEEDFVP